MAGGLRMKLFRAVPLVVLFIGIFISIFAYLNIHSYFPWVLFASLGGFIGSLYYEEPKDHYVELKNPVQDVWVKRYRSALLGGTIGIASFFLLAVLLSTRGLPSDAPGLPNSGFGLSLGLTPPLSLLQFQYRPEFPPYCRRENILQRVKDFAIAEGCTVLDTSGVDGAPLEMISCALSKPGNESCPSTYYAEVWQERWLNSSEDYELLAFARVRTVCVRERDFRTFRAPDEIEDAARRQTTQITNLLRSCRYLVKGRELSDSKSREAAP